MSKRFAWRRLGLGLVVVQWGELYSKNRKSIELRPCIVVGVGKTIALDDPMAVRQGLRVIVLGRHLCVAGISVGSYTHYALAIRTE
jgi:hypothetical protein